MATTSIKQPSMNKPVLNAATRNSRNGKESGGLLRRGPVGAVVIAAHIVIIYAVAASLGIVEMPNIAKEMQATIIDTPETTQEEPMPVIKPELEKPTVDTPPIEDTIPEIEVPTDEPAPAAIMAETSPSPPVGETANMKVDKRVDPVYPPSSRRAGEEGTGVFRVLVDPAGHASDVSVVRSSGFPRLDEAAMNAIRKWVFSPAMQSGTAVQSYTKVQVQFKLENAG